ncbi:poly (ADP-ribose) polymerase, putative, partial [Bodo saltans]
VIQHSGLDATKLPPTTYGSVRSCAAPLISGTASLASDVPQQVLDLVNVLYQDAWKYLTATTTLAVSTNPTSSALSSKTLMDVVKAESILQRIGEVLQSLLHKGVREESWRDSTELIALSKVPQKGSNGGQIASLEAYENSCDTVRSLRAMLSVGESLCGNIYNAPAEVKLATLGCVIRPLPHDHSDYHVVRDLIRESVSSVAGSPAAPVISAVMSVYSDEGRQSFHRSSRSIANHQLLFHGTRSSNLVSILREGLQVPLSGRLRRDAGMLGRGIYFGDSVYTALKYATPSSNGRYLVLISEVALGRPYDVREHRLDLVAPPEGFDSVHGIPTTAQNGFVEDEYVVYNAHRSSVSFLVELQWDGPSTRQLLLPAAVTLPVPSPWSENVVGPSSSVAEFKAPNVKDVESGLRTSSGKLVPLRNTRIRGKIVDLIAEVDVLQQYSNDSDTALETKYVFPLQSGCAVCAFEAYINDKKIVGKVKEKEEARKEYKAAVERGDGAYLLDESEETPDVFTVSVGNLPPKTDVVIRITYVLELRVHPALQAIEFIIPAAIVPLKEKQGAVKTQTKTRTEWSDATAERVGLELSIDMPFDIMKIECSQPQTVQRKRSACRAVLKASHFDLLEGDFVLYTYIRSISTPRIWVETHPTLQSSVAMITFFPEVHAPPPSSSVVDGAAKKEAFVLIDCSASMEGGGAMDAAKTVAILSLRALSRKWSFNVVLLGTRSIFLFPRSRKASLVNIEEAVKFVQASAGPWLGGSCLGAMLPSLARFVAAQGSTIDLLLISDGHIPESDQSLCSSLHELPALRLFTAAVGKGSNSTTLRSLSIAGRGQCEVFSDTSKAKWIASTACVVRRMEQEALSKIQVDWSTEQSRRLRDATNATIHQSPAHVASIFSKESTVVYGLLHHNNAIQCELSAVHCGRRVERDAYGEWPSQSFLVTTTGLSFVQGAMIHCLCAKARIKEYTDGVMTMDGVAANEALKEKTKQTIIDIGCLYGLVTPFTSMIAVEERTEDERAGRRSATAKPTPSIDSVGPSVDVLPEEVFEDALSSEDDEPQFSIVGAQHRKHLKAEKKRREEARRRRLDEEWVRPVSAIMPSSNEDDTDDDHRSTLLLESVGMGTRNDTAGSRLFVYAEPQLKLTDEMDGDVSDRCWGDAGALSGDEGGGPHSDDDDDDDDDSSSTSSSGSESLKSQDEKRKPSFYADLAGCVDDSDDYVKNEEPVVLHKRRACHEEADEWEVAVPSSARGLLAHSQLRSAPLRKKMALRKERSSSSYREGDVYSVTPQTEALVAAARASMPTPRVAVSSQLIAQKKGASQQEHDLHQESFKERASMKLCEAEDEECDDVLGMFEEEAPSPPRERERSRREEADRAPLPQQPSLLARSRNVTNAPGVSSAPSFAPPPPPCAAPPPPPPSMMATSSARFMDSRAYEDVRVEKEAAPKMMQQQQARRRMEEPTAAAATASSTTSFAAQPLLSRSVAPQAASSPQASARLAESAGFRSAAVFGSAQAAVGGRGRGGFGAPPGRGGFGAPPAAGFGAAPAFGAPPTLQAFSAAPAPGGFGAPPAPQGFGAPRAAGFGAPPAPQAFSAVAPASSTAIPLDVTTYLGDTFGSAPTRGPPPSASLASTAALSVSKSMKRRATTSTTEKKDVTVSKPAAASAKAKCVVQDSGQMDPELAALLASLDAIPVGGCQQQADTTDADLDRLLASLEDTKATGERISRELANQNELLDCMHSNIDSVLARGDRLEDLESKSCELADASRQFYKKSAPPQRSSQQDKDDLIAAFSVFDKSDSGYVTLAEMKHVMTNLGEYVPDHEIEEMFRMADTEGSGRINIQQFVELMESGGEVTWSEHAIHLSDLPAHFTLAQLAVVPKKYKVDRCPSTGMCLGTATLDYKENMETEMIAGVVNVLLLCDLYGWGWRLHSKTAEESVTMFKNELLSDGLRSLSTILQRDDELNFDSPIATWLPLLNTACGLPSNGLLNVFFHRYNNSDEAHDHGVRKSDAVRAFGRAILLLLQRSPLPERFSDLESLILPYSSTYIKTWNAFVWPVCVPRNIIPSLPFPFVTVEETDARNHYDDVAPSDIDQGSWCGPSTEPVDWKKTRNNAH